ncbi:hypothetical protein C7960_1772 [Methanohalophilus euhalobius]|jgi:hypothetical protein|uniref:Uncharacterized protein n=1 Tax=Methanohalophilus euhalobius TaxID=51203 RepID=A0A285FZS8_9EURY|nr:MULTISPECIES: hypothetical protein [Methanohalophilus]ODV49101.1 MAG: hypothetical protein A8273_1625 [Methanohalophilus sp. 2-GBenrich]RXG33760.1 hypothetical protein CI957_1589 [Methanohalophilus sp. WG1-DM]TCL12510.1 hypothetical protein C7960_1772 [Methanohalophilus euhalobius]SNY16765.1 hypothetical protein SAMN06295989_10658 [Methanohalophilus euhalobius]
MTDKVIVISTIGAIKESNKISLELITEKCGPLSLKFNEIEPDSLVPYPRSVNRAYILDKLISFKNDGIVKENVIFQFQSKQYYKDLSAHLIFFTVISADLERNLSNDEACSKLIEVMNEYI